MAIDLEKLKSELMALPIESRAWLANTLIESLDDAIDPDAESMWLEEIRRRDAEIKSGVAKTKPAEEEADEELNAANWDRVGRDAVHRMPEQNEQRNQLLCRLKGRRRGYWRRTVQAVHFGVAVRDRRQR